MSSNDKALPSDKVGQVYATVHALQAGFLTLPEHVFCSPSEEGKRRTVPSLSFLIQHQSPGQNTPTRLVFDLGLRRDTQQYIAPIREHIQKRQPVNTTPDACESLRRGGLEPSDVDYVVFSHVHWDHSGTPSDFPSSTFIVGHGSLDLLKNGSDPAKGSHAHFEPDMLQLERTVELPRVPSSPGIGDSAQTDNSDGAFRDLKQGDWRPLAHFPAAIDVFADGSVYIVNAPGHLQGHVNLLVRTGPSRWVYLAGDACHDRRILRGEVQIAEWKDAGGHSFCIHVDRPEAERTLQRIREVEAMQDGAQVEVILAHDVEWIEKKENRERFWPGQL